MAELSTGNGLPDVVVTGIAMTTALATDADSTWKKLLDSQSGIRERGIRAISPLGVQKAMPNAAAAAVGLERGAKAGIMTPVSACASGAEAIALAWRNIVLGEADMAICGGVETKIEAVPIAAYSHQNPTASCSAKRAHCWSLKPRSTQKSAAPTSLAG